MLDVGCWLLDVGYWMLVIGCWLLDVGCWMLVVGCWLLDVGCWLLDVGCWMLDVSLLLQPLFCRGLLRESLMPPKTFRPRSIRAPPNCHFWRVPLICSHANNIC